jgi:hypothetical protein
MTTPLNCQRIEDNLVTQGASKGKKDEVGRKSVAGVEGYSGGAATNLLVTESDAYGCVAVNSSFVLECERWL